LFFFYLTNKKQSKYFFIKKNKEVNLSYILNTSLIITGKYPRTGPERKVSLRGPNFILKKKKKKETTDKIFEYFPLPFPNSNAPSPQPSLSDL